MTKLVQALGYVGFVTKNIEDWKKFNTDILNVQSIESTIDNNRGLSVRFDESYHRFIITESVSEEYNFIGLDVGNEDNFHNLLIKLNERKIDFNLCSSEEIQVRKVKNAINLYDPAGHRVELFYGMEKAKFDQPRLARGFRTGDLGYGHLVLMTPKYEETRAFYIDNFDFKISDFILHPTRRSFMHVNARHHSIGIAERPISGLAHLMIEVNSIDDLGRAYDTVQRDYPNLITSSLGRHSNDHMISFYMQTPSGFPIEYGWGGRTVDSDWVAEEISGPSLWGHDRRSSPPDVIAFNDNLRKNYATLGTTYPVQVNSNTDSFDLSKIQ